MEKSFSWSNVLVVVKNCISARMADEGAGRGIEAISFRAIREVIIVTRVLRADWKDKRVKILL